MSDRMAKVSCYKRRYRPTSLFYYHDFWGTFSFRPNTTTLYLMISCDVELRNKKNYAYWGTFCQFLGVLVYKSVPYISPQSATP